MQLRKRMKDITGQKFGSLTAIKPVHISSQGTVVWEFRCVCGKHTEWIGNNVVSIAKHASNPSVPSCGCIKAQVARVTGTTHGYSKHPLQAAWQAMKQRCYNPNHPQYLMYGAKGVAVCQEWLNDSEAFIQWALANGWEKGKHLDKDAYSDAQGIVRVYSPATCRFVSASENVSYSSKRSNYKNNSRIRLTPEDVSKIQNLYQSKEMNQYELAKLFNVSQASIWRAIHKA